MNRENENQNVVTNNHAVIYGEVATEPKYNHTTQGQRFFKFMLKYTRTSGIVDTLPVILAERFIDDVPLLVGTTVQIDGHLRSYNRNGATKVHLEVYFFVKYLKRDVTIPECNNHVVHLNGYLHKDPVLRKTPKGLTICDIGLAVNRTYGYTDYVPCILWGDEARRASHCKTGDHIDILGRLQSREYNKKLADREEVRTALELSVYEFTCEEVSDTQEEIPADEKKLYIGFYINDNGDRLINDYGVSTVEEWLKTSYNFSEDEINSHLRGYIRLAADGYAAEVIFYTGDAFSACGDLPTDVVKDIVDAAFDKFDVDKVDVYNGCELVENKEGWKPGILWSTYKQGE